MNMENEENKKKENEDNRKKWKKNEDKRDRKVRLRKWSDWEEIVLKKRKEESIKRRIGMEGGEVIGKGEGYKMKGNSERFKKKVGKVVNKLRIRNLKRISEMKWDLEKVEKWDKKKRNDRKKGEVEIVRINIG